VGVAEKEFVDEDEFFLAAREDKIALRPVGFLIRPIARGSSSPDTYLRSPRGWAEDGSQPGSEGLGRREVSFEEKPG
jgi:hypothetical protein